MANVQGFVAMVQAAGLALQAFLAPAIGRVQEAFSGIGPKLVQLEGPLAGLQAAFATLWEVLQPILSQLAAAVGATLAVAMDLGINTLAAVIDNLPALIGPAINQVTATITLIATTVEGMAELVTAIINGDWDAAWKAAEKITAGFSTFFTNTLANWQAIGKAVFETLKTIITNTLADMGINIEDVLSRISAFWAGIWEGMGKAIQPVLDAIDGLKKGIQSFQSWISGISIPNPFAGIQLPSLPSLPALPGMASGGPVTGGAPIIVGERGPELFVPSSDGRIVPNNVLDGWGALAGAGAEPLVGPVYVNSEVDLHALAYQVAELLGRRR
jgi:phage-related protein